MAYRVGAPTLSQYWQTGYVNGIALAHLVGSLLSLDRRRQRRLDLHGGGPGTVISRSTLAGMTSGAGSTWAMTGAACTLCKGAAPPGSAGPVPRTRSACDFAVILRAGSGGHP